MGAVLRIAVGVSLVVLGLAGVALAADELPIGEQSPITLRRPAMSGLAREGETLKTSDGVWAGATPITYRYQWRRCDAAGQGCVDIVGATEARYTLTAADVGATVRSRVFATNSAGSDYRSSVVTPVITSPVGGPVQAPADGAYLGAWTSPNTG